MRRLQRSRTRGSRARSGQGLAELSIALPLLMLMLLGTIDMGRAFFDYIDMRQGVVEGAMFGQREPFNTGGIVAAVTGHGVPDDAVITVNASANCSVPGATGNVTVTAQKVFVPIFLATLNEVAGGGAWSMTLSAHETMRCLT